MLKPGIVSKTFQNKSPQEVLELCRQADLKGIEWSENAHITPGNPEEAIVLRKLTVNSGLQVAGYGSYYRLGENSEPEKVFSTSLLSAELLGAPYIRIWAGHKPSTDFSFEERLLLAKEAKIICDLAQEKHIAVTLEWHRKTLTDTNESAMAFLDEVNHPNLYCLWQPTSELSVGERCEGIDLLEKRNVLKNIHVYYWLGKDTRRPLKDGYSYWQEYLSHVDSQKDRYALLEFVMNDDDSQFLEDARTLHELISK